MRIPALLLIASAVASCTMAPPPSPQQIAASQAREQAELAPLIAGKVAGTPVQCLPPRSGNDMIIINERTVAFREGPSRVYLNGMRGGCPNLRSQYALVTRNFGSSGLCSGEIAQVIDPTIGVTVGSCVFGDFVPYRRPGR